jgi:hypothetical protein
MTTNEKKGFSGPQVLAMVAGTMLLTILVTIFAIRTWLFPQPFTPVVLNQAEEQRLEQKLDQLADVGPSGTQAATRKAPPPEDDFTPDGTLRPQAYSEKGAEREVSFSEREVNALLANNTDLARKMAIDLSDDLVSLRMLLPVDPDFPVMGGKTIRIRTGAELAYRDGRPVVMLRGVSLMGVPIPNAWLGGLKNIDLVREFGDGQGFWKTFSDGVESIQVRDGKLSIKLRE